MQRHPLEPERPSDASEPDREGVAIFAVVFASVFVLLAAALANDVMARWRVDIIRSRAEHLGVVEAANEQEAIEKGGQNLTVENGSFSENPGDGVIGGNGLSATARGLFFQFSLADFSTIVFPTTGFLCFEDASAAYSGVPSTISINLPGDP